VRTLWRIKMTWKDLAIHIGQMTAEQKQSHVTAQDSVSDEFYAVATLEFTTEDDVLDKDHPYLAF